MGRREEKDGGDDGHVGSHSFVCVSTEFFRTDKGWGCRGHWW